SIVDSGSGITNGNGNLNAGKVVTFTVAFSEAVTVSGGTPALALNDGGVANYTGGSRTKRLTFTYSVPRNQNTYDLDLVASAFNLNGATITDTAGNNALLTAANNYNPTGTLIIDTTPPTVSSVVASGAGIAANGDGNLNLGKVITLTVNLS